jgi:hypothetical protein
VRSFASGLPDIQKNERVICECGFETAIYGDAFTHAAGGEEALIACLRAGEDSVPAKKGHQIWSLYQGLTPVFEIIVTHTSIVITNQ